MIMAAFSLARYGSVANCAYSKHKHRLMAINNGLGTILNRLLIQYSDILRTCTEHPGCLQLMEGWLVTQRCFQR